MSPDHKLKRRKKQTQPQTQPQTQLSETQLESEIEHANDRLFHQMQKHETSTAAPTAVPIVPALRPLDAAKKPRVKRAQAATLSQPLTMQQLYASYQQQQTVIQQQAEAMAQLKQEQEQMKRLLARDKTRDLVNTEAYEDESPAHATTNVNYNLYRKQSQTANQALVRAAEVQAKVRRRDELEGMMLIPCPGS